MVFGPLEKLIVFQDGFLSQLESSIVDNCQSLDQVFRNNASASDSDRVLGGLTELK